MTDLDKLKASDTPRTDALIRECAKHDWSWQPLIDFARKSERELTALRERLAEAEKDAKEWRELAAEMLKTIREVDPDGFKRLGDMLVGRP